VRETVSDTFIEQADEIELVDLPTEELLKRLRKERCILASRLKRHRAFFQPGNLIALRQLALRYTERNVDTKLMSYKKSILSQKSERKDRFLVCISPSPSALG